MSAGCKRPVKKPSRRKEHKHEERLRDWLADPAVDTSEAYYLIKDLSENIGDEDLSVVKPLALEVWRRAVETLLARFEAEPTNREVVRQCLLELTSMVRAQIVKDELHLVSAIQARLSAAMLAALEACTPSTVALLVDEVNEKRLVNNLPAPDCLRALLTALARHDGDASIQAHLHRALLPAALSDARVALIPGAMTQLHLAARGDNFFTGANREWAMAAQWFGTLIGHVPAEQRAPLLRDATASIIAGLRRHGMDGHVVYALMTPLQFTAAAQARSDGAAVPRRDTFVHVELFYTSLFVSARHPPFSLAEARDHAMRLREGELTELIVADLVATSSWYTKYLRGILIVLFDFDDAQL